MLLELLMSATMQSGRAMQGVARKRAEATAVQEERIAPDVLEIAACERAVREELARPGCDAGSVAARLLEQGFPPLEPAWALLWSAEERGPTARAFVQANVSHLDVL